MTVAGSAHFLAPRADRPLVPRWLGPPEPWIVASGLAELLCAAGLAVPRTRTAAAWATAALFVVVFPGNMTMAVTSRGREPWFVAAAYGRLPLQLPFMRWVAAVAMSSRQEASRA